MELRNWNRTQGNGSLDVSPRQGLWVLPHGNTDQILEMVSVLRYHVKNNECTFLDASRATEHVSRYTLVV